MKKQNKNESGFSAVEIILTIVVIGIIGFVGWFVWGKNSTKNKPNNQESGVSTTDANKQAKSLSSTNEQQANDPTAKYLKIPEMGIKIKLTSNMEDAFYYYEKIHDWQGAYLSTHSLDKYPECKASHEFSGVAAVNTFHEGDINPLDDKTYLSLYPNAPKIGDSYYYIDGNQYDCTLDKDNALYSKVRKELIESYKSIEKL